MSQTQSVGDGSLGAASTTPTPGAADDGDDVLAAIQQVVDCLGSVDAASLDEHAERYKAVHETLQKALTDTDLRETS